MIGNSSKLEVFNNVRASFDKRCHDALQAVMNNVARMKFVISFFLFAVIFLAGCGKPDLPTKEEEDRVREAGQLASQTLRENLGTQLKAALQAGGPASAMQACQQVAALTTKAIGDSFDGVTIRRTTMKPRNPGNAPDETDRKVLKMLAASTELPKSHIEWTGDTGRYYEPLVIQDICLNCHGNRSEFSEELLNKLTTLYPDDQATGYGLGELRGAIRVDVSRETK